MYHVTFIAYCSKIHMHQQFLSCNISNFHVTYIYIRCVWIFSENHSGSTYVDVYTICSYIINLNSNIAKLTNLLCFHHDLVPCEINPIILHIFIFRINAIILYILIFKISHIILLISNITHTTTSSSK